MCGIAGILRTYAPGQHVPQPHQGVPDDWLRTLDRAIEHRGPDGHGRFADRVRCDDCTTIDIVLLHRRMAILDPSAGHQPMLLRPYQPGASDQLVVVFNGCIYNHRELRRELVRSQRVDDGGAPFLTNHSDTEVLLQGWRRWGAGLFAKLEGMFALAIWDRGTRTLCLATDRMGEKPLYVIQAPGECKGSCIVAFSSVVGGLVDLQDAIDPQAMQGQLRPARTPSCAQWLRFGWSPALPMPGIEQLGPGDVWIRSPEQSTRRSRWADAIVHDDEPLSVDRVDALLRDAVHARLQADVPMGLFLSGGIDSGLIAKYALERRPDIEAFTMRMPEGSHDESPLAQQTAQHLGARHRGWECSGAAGEDLIGAIERLGLPFGDSSLLPALWLSTEAGRHVRVALGGDGGDDLFLGYQRQFVALLLHRAGVGAESLRGLIGAWDHESPVGSVRWSKSGRLLDAIAHEGYLDLASIFPASLFARLVPDPLERKLPREWRDLLQAPDTDAFERAQRRFDARMYLPFDLLRKGDSASMASPLELRSPFLDSRLVGAAMGASRAELLRGGPCSRRRKGLLRALARRHLPAELVDAPKRGFAIPLASWLRSDFGGLRTLLGDMVIAASEPFPQSRVGLHISREVVRTLWDQHMRGTHDHAQRLYMLLVLAIWCRWMRR